MKFENWLADRTAEAAAELLQRLKAGGFHISFAESCTGGLLSGAFTAQAGASEAYAEGFVTYANRAKEELLAVPGELLARLGAVSAPVAAAMALGAGRRSGAELALAVTGIAGPGGGSPQKPVGLVYIGAAWGDTVWVLRRRFAGSRQLVRAQTVLAALELGLLVLDNLENLENRENPENLPNRK